MIHVKGEEALIGEMRDRLVTKFPHLHPDQVSRAVAEAQARFAQSTVRDFIPLLVERRARYELFRQGELAPVTS